MDIDTKRLRDRIAKLEAEVERLENIVAVGVHSCSVHCQRPMCVLQREHDALRAQLAEHAQDAIEREQELRRSIERNDGLRDELDALRARVEAAPCGGPEQ